MLWAGMKRDRYYARNFTRRISAAHEQCNKASFDSKLGTEGVIQGLQHRANHILNFVDAKLGKKKVHKTHKAGRV